MNKRRCNSLIQNNYVVKIFEGNISVRCWTLGACWIRNWINQWCRCFLMMLILCSYFGEQTLQNKHLVTHSALEIQVRISNEEEPDFQELKQMLGTKSEKSHRMPMADNKWHKIPISQEEDTSSCQVKDTFQKYDSWITLF